MCVSGWLNLANTVWLIFGLWFMFPCVTLKSPVAHQQHSNKRYCPVPLCTILARAFCPDVRTSVLFVFMYVSMSFPPPSSCTVFFSYIFPPLSELLSSHGHRQRQGEVIHNRWWWGGVGTVQPVSSWGSWVSILHGGAWKRELPVVISLEEIDGA